MTSLFESNMPEFWKTYEYLQETANIATCSWSPGYYAISADRLKKPDEALRAPQGAVTFSKPPWILFVENTQQVPGRPPYYLAGHALYVQALNEMLLQDWPGKAVLFPSCPFKQARFKLRGNNHVIEAELNNGIVKVISDKVDARTGRVMSRAHGAGHPRLRKVENPVA
jgi:hypothetical protein